jgi:DNA-binding transcriptional ArsR family regulator
VSAFNVLSEPSRRGLLDALREGAKPVNELVETVGMSQPVVSKHLRILREAGLVTVKPEGQRRLYRLNPQPLLEMDAWLEPYRRFWSDRLDALDEHLHALYEEDNDGE